MTGVEKNASPMTGAEKNVSPMTGAEKNASTMTDTEKKDDDDSGNDFQAARPLGPQPEGKTDDCEKPDSAAAEQVPCFCR